MPQQQEFPASETYGQILGGVLPANATRHCRFAKTRAELGPSPSGVVWHQEEAEAWSHTKNQAPSIFRSWTVKKP